MTDQRPTIVLPRELMQQWREQVWFVGNEAEREEKLMERVVQWVYDQCFKLPAHFHGVPLIPPVDCVDPQSWIAQRIYDMGYEQRDEVNEAELQQARDQELEAIIEVIESGRWFHNPVHRIAELRAARRPNPPSLAEQALEALRSTPCTEQRHYDALFAALERLKQLENNQ